MRTKGNKESTDWINKGVCGLVPIYGRDGGNYTKLIFKNKPSIIVERRIHTILVRLSALFQKDIRLIRKQAREITGQRSMNPLYINSNIILVPFKMRKPIGKDDGAVGYFFSDSIDRVIDSDKGVKLVLKDGQIFDIQDTYLTAKRHIGYAHQINFHLLKRDLDISANHGLFEECSNPYNLPATKGDLATLNRGIGKLIDRLDRLQR
jgi:hypothetical protein